MDENSKNHVEDLAQIRRLMERSSKFISLSGLSGVFAGLFGIMGALAVYIKAGYDYDYVGYYLKSQTQREFYYFMLAVGVIVLVLALVSAFYFTYRKTKKGGGSLWDPVVRKLTTTMAVPLVAGGLFCWIMSKYSVGYIPGLTLIFYGLALFSASRYTLNEIKYLGICEILLGLLSAMYIGLGLVFWTVGFGLLHVIYGVYMYIKYDRKSD